jgi:hypothetical protein
MEKTLKTRLVQALSRRHRLVITLCFAQITITCAIAYFTTVTPQAPLFSSFVPPRLSSHICVGENYHEDSWKYKSCHLQNICWNGNNFSYHVDPTDTASIPGPAEIAVSISTLGVTDNPVRWQPEVIPLPLPENAMWAQNIDKTDLHVLATEYNGSNFGHVLGDSLLPWWRLLDMFGLMEGDFPFQPIHMTLDPPFTYS